MANFNNTVQKTNGLLPPPQNPSPLYRGIQASGGLKNAFSSLSKLPFALRDAMQSRVQSNMLNDKLGAMGITTGAPAVQQSGGLGSSFAKTTAPLVNKPTVSSNPPRYNTSTPQLPEAGSGGISTGDASAYSTPPAQVNTIGQKAPAGMEYNAQGNLVPAVQTTNPNPNSYSGLVSQAAGMASQPSDLFTNAQNIALGYNRDLSNLRQEEAKGIGNIELNGGTPMSQALGEEGAINNLYAARENALASAFQGASSLLPSATSQQEAQISGTLGAAKLAAPQQVPYSNQFLNPVTGQPIGGGGVSGSLQDAVQKVVQKLSSSQMTYNDAVQALSGYGQGGLNALQQALPPGFNIAQSNALAGQQGSITPALNYATIALNHAKDTLSGLQIPGQTSNVGLLSDVSNWFSNLSGIGKEATRTKEGALAEARSAIQSVLASVRGGNPTEYRDQSYALLPNNATPADIDAAMQNLQTLGSAKQSIYSNPGQVGQTSGSTSGGIQTPYGTINPEL